MQPSPRWVGRVVMRRSTLRSSTLTQTRPSWGTRFSAMSMSLMIFTRRDDAGDHPLRHPRRLVQHAVDPEADPHLALVRLEVDVGGALGDRLAEDRVDELDHRRVVGRLAQLGDLAPRPRLLVLLDRLGDRGLERVEAADQRLDVVLGGDRDRQLSPVIIWMSSTASTLAGSAIASSRVSLST